MLFMCKFWLGVVPTHSFVLNSMMNSMMLTVHRVINNNLVVKVLC